MAKVKSHRSPKPRYNTKLTEQKVRTIRRRYANGVATETELADHYDVSQACISKILNRITWKSVEV